MSTRQPQLSRCCCFKYTLLTPTALRHHIEALMWECYPSTCLSLNPHLKSYCRPCDVTEPVWIECLRQVFPTWTLVPKSVWGESVNVRDAHLWVCEVCAQHLADVLCVRQVQSGVHLVQDVDGGRFEQQHGQDERQGHQRPAGLQHRKCVLFFYLWYYYLL